MITDKRKFITFSFDDGNEDDIRLIEILNKYGLKATFNLNSGNLSYTKHWSFNGVKEVYHINYTDKKALYNGHEVAAHSYSHPQLEALDEATLSNEIELDRIILSNLFGQTVKGFALPFGSWNDAVLAELEKRSFTYCRSTRSTYSFGFPDGILLDPTCHFKNAEIFELADKFFNLDSDTPAMLYIWGHSYELVTDDDWSTFEQFCKKISGRKDVCYCTNIEAIEKYRILQDSESR